MRCLECNTEIEYLDNRHLLGCCSLTLQEYAIRHHLPLDLLVHSEALNQQDPVEIYGPPAGSPSEQARAVLRGLKWAGLLRMEGEFAVIPGEIRRLDMLLWVLQWLREYGFRFRQEYRYQGSTHRVVAYNRLKVPASFLVQNVVSRISPVPPPDFQVSLAVMIAHVGELQAGYLFLHFPDGSTGDRVAEEAARQGIRFKVLDAADLSGGRLLRTLTLDDSERLLAFVRGPLQAIPGAIDRYEQKTPEVTVAKELVFDAAHFITDHPAKCSNLHGGRYRLHVKVKGRIDPVTGCVVDYGYLKRVASRLIIDRFDHHNLNYAAAALAWRSSTEMLCIYIWEQLIEYLPGLAELQLYETTQSWCDYTGPTLQQYQAQGSDRLMTHFTGAGLGRSHLRNLIQEKPVALGVVAEAKR